MRWKGLKKQRNRFRMQAYNSQIRISTTYDSISKAYIIRWYEMREVDMRPRQVDRLFGSHQYVCDYHNRLLQRYDLTIIGE